MTRDVIFTAEATPHFDLDRLVATHGAWRVARTLISVLMARGQARSSDAPLSNHLRRDIGLPDADAPPPMRGPMF